MAQLSSEERIKRVEMAPVEAQTMVAKAFLRDDIDDEDVQYKFNTDSIEELNENGMEGVENINAEPTDEGIGAGSFKMRTSKPYDNKNYIRTANGGWNTCIKGNPTDAHANVLANCVGYASGRFNEIINDAREKTGCTYTNLNCNAENFADRAKADGLEMGSTPRVGAIGCMWGAGDKAGHVFIVEKVYSNSKIYTSESGWGSSTAFWNQTRDNSNGRWGMSSSYSFRCFIYLPSDVQKIVDGGSGGGVTPNVDRDIYKNQIEVKISDLRVRNGAGTDKGIIGMASKGFYNYYETADASGYKWYRIADGQWIASNDDWTTVYPAQPKPTPTYKYKVGDKVIINGQLYGNADGGNPGQTVHNKVTNITRVAEGHPYPYNTTGDLGWMAESSISPYVEPTPTPQPTGLQVGDKVKIIGTGNGSSYGGSNTAYGIGWTRQILRIWSGRPYPYQVGNGSGTTGFYPASSLQKL